MKQENLFTPNCIRTRSGIYVNVLQPTEDMICIDDIAHALSFQCRFSGHLPQHYSVAQHSVLCAGLATSENKIAALLHDASEAYLVDIARPVKVNLSNYKEIEDRFMQLIASKFGFEWPMCKEVEEIDDYMLKQEWHGLMLEEKDCMFSYSECWTQFESKKQFLETFNELTK